MDSHKQILSETIKDIGIGSLDKPKNEDSKHDKYINQVQSESMCDVCSYPMQLVKGQKRKKYGKSNDYYVCPNCGNKFRCRTQNEILRDLGERE